jgi:hypothetical protein
MNKPGQFFGFLVALGIAVFALSIVLPSGKAELGPFELGYYHPKDLLGPFWTGETSVAAGVDHGADPLGLDSIALEEEEAADSVAVAVERELELAAEKDRLAVPEAVLDTSIQVVDVRSFAPYFEALSALEADPSTTVRVIHYGDSQLEGDRITMNLRDQLQKKYGGSGFGYVALSPLVAPSSLNFKSVEGLARKTVFGRRDTAIHDGKYGHLASFSMLEPSADSTEYSAEISFAKRNWGFRLARNFSKVRMHLEGSAPVEVMIYVEDTLYSTRVFPVGEWTLGVDVPEVKAFTMRMRSSAVARVYGISFESPSGIAVDNVAMRGASGMMFTKIDPVQLQESLQREQYALIIMQFGGNAVPYLKDEAHAKRFARAAGRQVGFVQRLYPDAAILYIGPSDMAYKEGLDMQSYPLIPALKSAMRAELLSRGAGYWDLYDVMGGEGSMVDWVNQDPALAVKDYIHFTPKGASWVGKRLAAALASLGMEYERVVAEDSVQAELAKNRAAERAAFMQATGATNDTTNE